MRSTILFALLIHLSFLLDAQKLILPGTHPDPSIAKIDGSFWITNTSSNWFPAFPLYQSTDLINWKHKGYIFDTIPAWADSYFWAPEITYESGKVFVYYTARKKGGSYCVGVASADKPEGPYKDHGPLICQDYGAIDGFPIRDTTGKLYLVWKEDANSVGFPTPIWAAEMNEERTALIGNSFELFRNDKEWEQNLVEGVSIIKHNEYFYAFYAAAGCCGLRCTYVTGVARAKSVLGPWEKYDKNPVLGDDEKWICKGHGTPIFHNNKYYFIYHGYDKRSSAYTGRQGLLQQFYFTNDGWPKFIEKLDSVPPKKDIISDDFKEDVLAAEWQWNIFKGNKYKIKNGKLWLAGHPSKTGRFISRKIWTADYIVTTEVLINESSATAGLAAIGDEDNIVSVFIKNNNLSVVQVKNGKETIIEKLKIIPVNKVYLKMQVRDRFRITFSYSLNEKDYMVLNKEPIIATFLPPWDNPPRVGLVAKGDAYQAAVFEQFELSNTLFRSDKVRLNDSNWFKNYWLYILPALVLIAVVLIVRKRRKRTT